MRKLFSIVSLAGVVTFSLFVFMAYLVNSDEVKVAKNLPHIPIDVYQTKEEKPAVDKIKKLPEPPKALEPMPKITTIIETGEGPHIIDTGININVPPNHLRDRENRRNP